MFYGHLHYGVIEYRGVPTHKNASVNSPVTIIHILHINSLVNISIMEFKLSFVPL